MGRFAFVICIGIGLSYSPAWAQEATEVRREVDPKDLCRMIDPRAQLPKPELATSDSTDKLTDASKLTTDDASQLVKTRGTLSTLAIQKAIETEISAQFGDQLPGPVPAKVIESMARTKPAPDGLPTQSVLCLDEIEPQKVPSLTDPPRTSSGTREQVADSEDCHCWEWCEACNSSLPICDPICPKGRDCSPPGCG